VLLPTAAQAAFDEGIATVEHEALPAYLRQMNILVRLEPGMYQENHAPYALEEARLAIIYQGQYSLLPLYEHQRWADVDSVRPFVATLFDQAASSQPAEADLLLARSARASQGSLRESSPEVREMAKALACTPIIINWDHVRAKLPLAEARQGHRGIGDHAL